MVRTVFKSDSIHFSYTKNQPVLDGISLSIEDQSIFGIIGLSGSGKTTLAKVMLGLEKAKSGQMIWFNEHPNESTNRRVGYVPQDLALIYDLTVYENVFVFGKLYLYRGERLKNMVEQALQLVGLWKVRHRQLSHLTFYQLQLLNIACGIVHAPHVVIFDEVTALVSKEEQQFILDIVRQLHDLGITIVLLTKNFQEIQSCTHTVELCNGRVKLSQSTNSNIIANPTALANHIHLYESSV